MIEYFYISSRLSGKEPTPIRSGTLDKIKSLGEQHLVFRHNREPKGYPSQVGPRPMQCKTCNQFFRVEKLLERHAKTCAIVKKDTSAAASSTTASSAAASSVVPCKVEIKRSQQADDVAKKRKLSAGVEQSADKRRNTAKTKADADDDESTHTPPAASPVAAKKSAAEKEAPAKKKGGASASASSITSYFSSDKSKSSTEKAGTKERNGGGRGDDDDDDSSPANDGPDDHDDDDGNDADDEGDHESTPLPSDLISLGDRWWKEDKLEGGFACPLCKTRPLSKPTFIEDHVAASHFKQKRYICTICRKKSKEEEDFKEPFAWSHKSTLEDHMKSKHSLQWARQEKLDFKLSEVEPLLPDAVNVMRLFFKLYPKKGTSVKPKYAPKKPNVSDTNQKKSKW